ncbi:Pectinesterase inhibitor domain [Macleaya cordata]|uniref:Pectinesterase inhibitor domain n=1 Tax=Macleaya cordata TaxID=56857 RepID=A0A200QCV0_MACCD|nr:Pectinesterase inhibitor domain [Macleaya cordata]
MKIEAALRDCRSLVEDAVDKVETSISSMEAGGGDKNMLSAASKISDIRTWLSGALTDQDTCLDSLEEMMMMDVDNSGNTNSNNNNNNNIPEETKTAMKNAREYTSNSLAIISNIPVILRDLQLPPLLHR